MAQGTLQRCFSRMVSCFGHAMRLPSTRNVLMKSLRITGFSSSKRVMSWYQLLCWSIALRKAVL